MTDLLAGLPEITLTPDGKRYVSEGKEYRRVTDIISKVLPPYLTPWAEKVGQQAALHIYQHTGQLPETQSELMQEARNLGITCEDEKNKGADRGSALHLAIESLVLTGNAALALEDFDNPDHMKYAQSFSDFQLDYAPDFEAAEVRIAHPELDYAGTFDAIAICRKRPKGARGPDMTGKRIILDWKTNSEGHSYPQHLWQLAAYQLACEHWGIPVEGSAVVALGPKGMMKRKTPYSFKPSYIEPSAFAGVVDFFNLAERQMGRNPLGRKKQS